MHLIDDVHLKAATDGKIMRVIQQLPHLFNPGIGRGIHLQQITESACINIHASLAFTTRRGPDTLLAIQTFC